MLYIGVSSFTIESAAFVYNTAGALSLYITDDMIPTISPIRLNTQTFGVFIPQIAQRFPGLMMKLLVKMAKAPVITFEPNNATVQSFASVTAYAIQPNATLTPLFVLNLVSSVSARVFVRWNEVGRRCHPKQNGSDPGDERCRRLSGRYPQQHLPNSPQFRGDKLQ
ncbi:bactericidal permeability-increasing protein-like [Pseudochaenichthys georgianus]|uniref:bactericidal permeability-increasing protein-like n=1 Tax=Pseudochaenichthys georgianus TaxID=52239 RepID=UPI0039C0C47A